MTLDELAAASANNKTNILAATDMLAAVLDSLDANDIEGAKWLVQQLGLSFCQDLSMAHRFQLAYDRGPHYVSQ